MSSESLGRELCSNGSAGWSIAGRYRGPHQKSARKVYLDQEGRSRLGAGMGSGGWRFEAESGCPPGTSDLDFHSIFAVLRQNWQIRGAVQTNLRNRPGFWKILKEFLNCSDKKRPNQRYPAIFRGSRTPAYFLRCESMTHPWPGQHQSKKIYCNIDNHLIPWYRIFLAEHLALPGSAKSQNHLSNF